MCTQQQHRCVNCGKQSADGKLIFGFFTCALCNDASDSLDALLGNGLTVEYEGGLTVEYNLEYNPAPTRR